MATAQDVLKVAQGWVGYSERNGKHQEILKVYNAHKPLARGYAMKISDDWCDAFVSACAIKANAVDLIGTEVGVPKHVEIFKQKGIWNEDGTVRPQPGWLIVYAWGTSMQPNNAAPKHIGIVESVAADNMITVIEGNRNEAVQRRSIPVGWGFIRGYAMPKYDVGKNLDAIAKEVIAGKWGNGQNRIDRLKAAGYDYSAVQKRVNALLKK